MAIADYDLKKVGIFLLFTIVLICTILGIGTGIYFYSKYKTTAQELRNIQLTPGADAQSIIDKVSKLIAVPEDEQPTIATVTDLERLKNQPFFAKAKIGDRVLIYTKNKKAILFDPVENKILEVGPLILPTEASGSAKVLAATTKPDPTKTPTPTRVSIRTVIYNGTNDSEAVNVMDQRLKKVTGVKLTVVNRDNTSQKEYADSLIVDISGKFSADAKAIGEALKIGVGPLPEGEKKPEDADLLIIVGLDKSG